MDHQPLKMNKPLLFFIVLILVSCHSFRAIKWGKASPNDHKHFSNVVIPASKKAFYYSTSKESIGPIKSQIIQKEIIAKGLNTHAFLIIQNDQIVYQYFKKNKDSNSLFLGFSMSKSFVATCIGIAIDKGLIKSTSESICTYIPELAESDTNFRSLTIQALLDMRSGIEPDENKMSLNSPLVKMYYGQHISKLIPHLKRNPRYHKFHYLNINTQLLSLAIERASKQSFNSFFAEHVWSKMGCSHRAQWVIDKDSVVKSFFGLSATAYDFAKLGSLYLHEGQFNGQNIVSESWINQSTHLDTLFENNYKNHWWANNDTRFFSSEKQAKDFRFDLRLAGPVQKILPTLYTVKLPGNSYMAHGFLEQYLYVNPEKNLIIIRLGDDPDNATIDFEPVLIKLGNLF